MNHSKRSSFSLALALGILVADAVVPTFRMGAQGQTTPQAADLLLNNARRAYNEKNYTFAADRFREFLNKFGNHKEANAAHYELALCLIEGPAKDYNGALGQLQPLANNKDLPQHPFVLYYLGLAQRGLGAQALGQARSRPQEANQHRNAAR